MELKAKLRTWSTVALAACGLWDAPAFGAPIASTKILLLSDIHFDALADGALVDQLIQAPVAKWKSIFESGKPKLAMVSGYQADANYALLKSALTAAAKSAHGPGLVLISGDFLVHKFEARFDGLVKNASHAAFELFALKAMQFEARMIREAFPDSQIVPALGNNDSACGDYYTQPGSPFLRGFAEEWKESLGAGDQAAAFVGTFAKAGYYSVPARADSNVKLIVLNGTYWSRKYENHCAPSGADSRAPGRDQLAWLRTELEASRTRGEKVWLLNHIPAGVDGYRSLRDVTDLCAVKAVGFYQDGFADAFRTLLHEFHSEIQFSVTGHTHKNDFRVLGGDRDDSIADLIVPSVSPVAGNNPSFTVLTARTAGLVPLDSAVYILSDRKEGVPAQTAWKLEYKFNSTYHLKGFSSDSLRALAKKIRNPGPDRETFIRYFDGLSPESELAELKETRWLGYWCTIEHQDSASYQMCICPSKGSR